MLLCWPLRQLKLPLCVIRVLRGERLFEFAALRRRRQEEWRLLLAEQTSVGLFELFWWLSLSESAQTHLNWPPARRVRAAKLAGAGELPKRAPRDDSIWQPLAKRSSRRRQPDGRRRVCRRPTTKAINAFLRASFKCRVLCVCVIMKLVVRHKGRRRMSCKR